MHLLAMLLFQAVAASMPTPDQPRVSIQSEEYLLGPVTLRATLEPAETTFSAADFFVDGAAVCRVVKPPIACVYDAGPQLAAHRVRVAVTLTDGRRLSATFESTSMALNESVSVRNVLVPVVVWDWRGRFISGLTKESFVILEDGVAQPVQFFIAEDVPLELTLAIDVSDSMRPIFEKVKVAAKDLLSTLKPADRVNLLAFNERVYTLTRPDASVAERARAVDQLRPSGGTALFDAIVRGIALLGHQMSRRAVIVLTDGKDEHSLSTIEGIESRLSTSDVLLYVITYGRGSDIDQLRAQVDRIADQSGGRGYNIRNIDDLHDVFGKIIADLSQHYLLSYTPGRSELDGTFRKIQVKLQGKSEREYAIKARAGYRAASPAR